MNNNQAQRERILARALEKDTPLATYPLPIGDVKNTLHTLVGLFPLETLVQLSEGLARCVEVIQGCAGEETSESTKKETLTSHSRPRTRKSTGTQPPSSVPTPTRPRTTITSSTRADIVQSHQDGQATADIARDVGLKYTTVAAIIGKAKRDAEGGGK